MKKFQTFVNILGMMILNLRVTLTTEALKLLWQFKKQLEAGSGLSVKSRESVCGDT